LNNDIEIIGKATNGHEAIRRCFELAPDLVLMDLAMPGMDGVAATRHICQHFPAVRVLILTSGTDYNGIHAALQAGARGYLKKMWTLRVLPIEFAPSSVHLSNP
jgi:DNA-binding NarL/FixJ family response regulator